MTDRVVAAGNDYEATLEDGRSDIVVKMLMSAEEGAEISKVYNDRLVSKRGVERNTYDQIKTLVGKCPFCGLNEVWEVDHYLPNCDFPELNVLPKNLVPICHGCNHTKLNSLPEAANRSLLHPYFDELPNEKWLFANLTIEDGGPVLDYYVQLDAHHGILAERLVYHFDKLGLSIRMKALSAEILVEMQADIEEFLEYIDLNGIKEHFQAEGEKAFSRHGNTIEMAAYFAAAENDEYCLGGYRN